MASSSASLLQSSLSSQTLLPPLPRLLPPLPSPSIRPISASSSLPPPLTRRAAVTSLSGVAGFLSLLSSAPPAFADIEDEYKNETQKVIEQVRSTLGLDKADPSRGDAVKALRQTCNDWVAKYRREKRFAGKPSYSNMYSVLNAVSGHYISYGDGSVLPPKRKNQILEEIQQAEKALSRGR